MNGRFAEQVKAGKAAGELVLWLDAIDYLRRVLLGGGSIPWFDAAATAVFFGTARRLLRADVCAIPIAGFFDQIIAVNAGLRARMLSRNRLTYPIKMLLADEEMRSQAHSVVEAIAESVVGQSVAIILPTPRALLELTYKHVHGPLAVDIEEDDVDIASAYLADFLRSFANLHIHSLLFEIDPSEFCRDDQREPWWQPVANLATHYRWDLGLHLFNAHLSEIPGVSFVINESAANGSIWGSPLPAQVWNEGAITADADFLFAHIPPDAVPESVLKALARLRGETKDEP